LQFKNNWYIIHSIMIKFGMISPHPPILVPPVGGPKIKEAERSQRALREAARRLKAIEREIDTIVVVTPHGSVLGSTVPVYANPVFEGDFSNFGASKPRFSFKGDPELAVAIIREDSNLVSRTPETMLDHGALVPLYYLNEAGIKKPLLPIGMAFTALPRLFEFGKLLAAAADKLKRRIALVASADMSHRLTEDAAAGFDPSGKVFDEKLVDLVRRNDVNGILNFDPALAETAGQDALWSIAVLIGALDGKNFKPEVLSYEGPFGVGYMVATFEPAS